MGRTTLRITPKPAADGTMYLLYRYNELTNSQTSTTAGDGSTATTDNSLVGNFTQIKTDPIP
jgi:hypothetical protein